MFKYYCPKCNKICDFDEEIELKESDFEGDWQEFHIECNTKVVVSLKADI